MLLTSARWLQRLAFSVLVLGGLAFALLVLSLRYWLLPNIAQYRESIAASISQAAGQRVTIGQVGAGWDGLRPHLSLRQVRVYDHAGQPALDLEDIEGTLAWWSLALGEIRLYSLEIDGPKLALRRTAKGEIYVGGVWVNQPDTESGFADWMLRQHRIIVRNATLTWLDDMRQAPLLELRDANLRIENRGRRHRFGLRGRPPAELALPIDIRGDLKGAALKDFSGWKGTFYARLENTDIAAWRPWVDLPFQVEHGNGGLQAWLGIAEGQVRGVTADLRLNDVVARLARELPMLDLSYLGGRLHWRDLEPGQTFQAIKVAFAIRGGANFVPSSFRLKMVPAVKGDPALGEFETEHLALAPLAALADYLPLDGDIRNQLRRLEPRGTVRAVSAGWRGTWPTPEQYAVKMKFDDLSVQSPATGGAQPSFAGLSGSLDANQKGGALALNTRKLTLDLPAVFDHPVGLDSLTAQLEWGRVGQEYEFKLRDAALSNSHLAGVASGSYRTSSGGPGEIDLTATFNRGDARFVSFYMPLAVGRVTRDWLAQSLKAGQASNVRLRLKGDLAKFPFEDGKSGVFEVAVKADGGVLQYAPEWPAIEGIAVDLLFHGASMDIYAKAGHTYGMQISKVHTRIADLLHSDELLTVDGEAHGPTGDMLKFVAQSPVTGMLDNFTEGMGAEGNGKFGLSLKIPLRRIDDMTVAGSYAFQNNKIMLGEGLPTLDQVNGTIQFTGTSVTMKGLTAQFLGGPASISAATQQGTVLVSANGKATAIGLSNAYDLPVMKRLKGSAKWNGQIALRKKLASGVFTSNLQGLASELPAPFGKLAEDVMPLRLERKAASVEQDSISFSLGSQLTALMERRVQGNAMKVERGAINLGPGTAKATQSGIWLTGSLAALDVDHWRQVLGQETSGGFPVDGVNLSVGTLDVLGKRFSDFRVNAWIQGTSLQATLDSKEMNGSLNWNRNGPGRVRARFKSFSVPPSAPAKLSQQGEATESTTSANMPSLDIIVDNFSARNLQLGRLELAAAPVGRDWRIEKAKLSTPDSTLSMDGVWQDWLQQPRSHVNLMLDTSDIGRLLAQFGYPGSVKGGNAKLKGQFYWSGSPMDFDYRTLTGLMSLEAHKGQFLKIEPGLGKLLGVLSLQALPRRISLDFRDVFSDGFAFDDISVNVKVKDGVVSGNDFKMDGPAAKVSMKGETDLSRETQNLRVRVVPVMGDTVSGVATLLGGPVAGLTSLLAQRILKDPLGQIAAYEYDITGTWDNPTVRKLQKNGGDE